MLLEICAYNIQSCILAARSGAGRIELCADPAVGGTTPSFGTIQYAIEKLVIPVFPMIRPRGGNFVYIDDELEIMRRDIATCKSLGCTGIAVGVLTAGNRIDISAMTRIVEWAFPMEVTCHKAFDRTIDAAQSLEDLVQTGCRRVLTSGLHDTAVNGALVLAGLVTQATGRIIIMPGGGVRSGNLAQLATQTRAAEYHSSGIVEKNGDYTADEQEIKLMINSLRRR